MKRTVAFLLSLTMLMTGFLFPASASDVSDMETAAEETATAEPIVTPEATAEPTAPPTAAPTEAVEAAPIQEVTAVPEATQVTTAEPESTLTPEPTAEAAATEEPQLLSDLTDLPDFAQGYVRLLSNARAYETAEGSGYAGVLAKGVAVYAVDRANAGGAKDRVQAVVNVEGELRRYWLTAEKLLPLNDEEIDALKKTAGENAPCVHDDPDLPLLKGGWTAYAEDAGAQPDEDAAVAPTETATLQPPAEDTSVPTAAPSAEESSDVQMAEEASPMDGTGKKDPTERSMSTYTGKSLWSSWVNGKTETVYRNTSSSPQSALPETAHGDYGNGVDHVYFYSRNKVAQLTLTFDSSCRTESSYDGVLVYNAKGQYVAGYSGTQMAGRILRISGNAAYIRFVSDGSNCGYYGMRVTEITEVNIPELTVVTNDGKGKVQLFWTNHPGCSYQISRATISASGNVGSYKYIKTVSGYGGTDTTAEMGRRYVYRVRAFTKIGTTVYYSGYNTMKVYTFKTTVLSGKASSDGTVKLSWKAVGRANTRYEVYRAPTGSTTFTLIASVKDLTYTDTLPTHAMYQYRVRPYTTLYGTEYATGYSATKIYGIPQPPETFKAYGMATRVVTLTWTKVPKAAGYVVYRAPSTSGPFTYVGSTTTALTLTDRGATRGAVNYYYICSYLLSGSTRVYGDYSAPISIVPVGKPTGLSCGYKAATSARISWDSIAGADEYIVYYKYTKSSALVEAGRTTSTSYLLSGLTEKEEYLYVAVRAVRTDGGLESRSVMSSSLTIRKNPRTLRALYIVEADYPGTESDLLVYDQDVSLLRGMTSRATPLGLPISHTATYTNLSKASIMSRISTFAGYADSNDITMFYLLCHGASDVTYGSNAGCLQTTTMEWITFYELATALKKIPGQVVVLLGSCGSGSAIGKGMTMDGASDFTSEAISAFAAADESISFVDADYEVSSLDATAKTSELCVSGKFYVIATAKGGTYGWTDRNGSFLLQWMNGGVMGADANGNGTVTLDEMGSYLSGIGSTSWIYYHKDKKYYRMLPQIYPTGTGFPLFKRR